MEVQALLERVEKFHVSIPTMIINQPHRQDRWQKTMSELDKIKSLLNIQEPIAAVDTDFAYRNRHLFFSIHVENNIARGPFCTSIIPTWSAAACAISHLLAWQRIAQGEDDFALIVEDDIEIHNADNLRYYLYEALFRLRDHQKKVVLFNSKMVPHFISNYHYTGFFENTLPFPFETNFKNLAPGQYYHLLYSHFYIMTKEAAIAALDEFFPIEYQMDIHLTKILKNKCGIHIHYTMGDDCGVRQGKKEPSTTQFYEIKDEYEVEDIFMEKIPLEICKHVFLFCKKKVPASYGYYY